MSAPSLAKTGLGLVSSEPAQDAQEETFTPYEEELLLKKLARCKRILESEKGVTDKLLPKQDAVAVRRLYRKLQVRKKQRSLGRTCWTLEKGSEVKKSDDHDSEQDARDRLRSSAYIVPLVPHEVTESPYTGRLLKPFIRRAYDIASKRVHMHAELLQRVNGVPPPKPYPLDFCYIRPHHVAAVNRLAREHFWPGIDVSESLAHPDFSVVALYRRLVVGFAFMLPSASNTEAYITFLFTHPDWRRLGLAKFFLYHLIQSCSGKDVVLHVSANNPAVVLYQNFGFKVEERVADFYDKYLPADSKECKHALFLRLAR